MSEAYTPEVWQKECTAADTGELLHWLTIYMDGNPLGWTNEQIGILRNEIERRRK